MNDQHGNAGPDHPDHPEPDPRLRGYPPPLPPGYAGPPPAMVPWTPPPPLVRPPALPLQAARYSSLLRGPRHRWWKPPLTALLATVLFLGFSSVAVVPPLVVGLVTGVADLPGYVFRTLTELDDLGPVGFFAVNLALISLIPTTMLSIWIVHGVRPRFTSSVTGGLRWGWMGRCLLLVTPVWLLYVGFSVLVDQPSGPPPEQWVLLLAIVLLTTPLQAAGEEYLFRGWVMQVVGSWFSRPVLGLVAVTIVSTITFSAAHGSPDIWILGSIGCLAVAGCLATWRTGGLEAAIAMHTVNNLLAFCVTLFFGGWESAFVSAETRGTVFQFALSALVHGVALALVWWQAGRVGLPYLSRPSLAPAPALTAGTWPPPPPLQPTR